MVKQLTQHEFEEGWKHFCKCIDWAQSALDAKAIQFMNEMPSRIMAELKSRDALARSMNEAMNTGDGSYHP